MLTSMHASVLKNLGCSWFLTGSRAIGGADEKSDWDYAVYSPTTEIYPILKSFGYRNESEAEMISATSDYAGDSQWRERGSKFSSWRNSDGINLIVMECPIFWAKWDIATKLAKERGAKTRPERITVFKEVLYGDVAPANQRPADRVVSEARTDRSPIIEEVPF